jgi:hypothetical protein
MTQDEIKALIEDLRLNHEFCPQEVILQAADELEKMVEADDRKEEHGSQVRTHTPEDIKKIETKWVSLTDEEIKEIIGPWGETPVKGYTRKLFDQIEAKLKEKNT